MLQSQSAAKTKSADQDEHSNQRISELEAELAAAKQEVDKEKEISAKDKQNLEEMTAQKKKAEELAQEINDTLAKANQTIKELKEGDSSAKTETDSQVTELQQKVESQSTQIEQL